MVREAVTVSVWGLGWCQVMVGLEVRGQGGNACQRNDSRQLRATCEGGGLRLVLAVGGNAAPLVVCASMKPKMLSRH